MNINLPYEAISKYIDRRRGDILNCRQALEIGDLSVIQAVGHQLKGNGITFGFPEISHIGEALETAAKNHNTNDVKQWLDELSKLIDKQTQLH